jgi:hypothetical protein
MTSEMEIEWRRRLDEAMRRARAEGRGDVAEYLILRAVNDAARAHGIESLLQTFLALAGEANRAGAGIQIQRTEPHRFQTGASTMVGARLSLRQRVRELNVEAGYPRAPSDGIVRGGGLALARISHYGKPRAACELLLVGANSQNAPQWFIIEDARARAPFLEADARRHLALLCEIK